MRGECSAIRLVSRICGCCVLVLLLLCLAGELSIDASVRYECVQASVIHVRLVPKAHSGGGKGPERTWWDAVVRVSFELDDVYHIVESQPMPGVHRWRVGDDVSVYIDPDCPTAVLFSRPSPPKVRALAWTFAVFVVAYLAWELFLVVLFRR